MKINQTAVRQCLKSFNFKTLFREHLGWDNHQGQLDIPLDGSTFSLSAVAQKRGFAAYVCTSVPDRPTRLKIDQQVTKSSREHLIVYADKGSGEQVWQWVRREPGKPLANRDHRFDVAQSGDPLIQRLEAIAVSLDEEEKLTVVDVAGRARAAFDVEKVTKQFYDRFKSEHTAFQKFIKGIKEQADLEWYTSLMLNRMMFVYFIQKKGFLDGDRDYLRTRMKLMRQEKGKDKFVTFYRYFLVRLFHDGLGKAKLERDAALDKLLGNVPYLNGGFFEVHQLEEKYTDIDIPDKAFEKLFDFFDLYRWHLDERPLRQDNEINPDVVGYIFEKYINQKQMGAYYTKEDITEYISKNTIIPFLFDAAEKKCPIAFRPESYLWRLLKEDPDRYIYAPVKQGVIDANGAVIPLPEEIEAGMKDVAKRDGWNKLATAPYASPTETWREHTARRSRCIALREKLKAGEVQNVHDLITLNLDIWQFARDVITNSEGPELLRAFWQAIESVTCLDPTCGSGAFLFAALRILESLYSDCLERMEQFVEDLAGKDHHPEKFADFKAVLGQIATHPNRPYFILKSIIISNLFGVDIMEEAVEICKLRLFLKLVAQVETVEQIEPLPDIDFNIRAGNTLIGYASLAEVRKSMEETLGFAEKQVLRIEGDALVAEKAFNQFRAQQTRHGGKVTADDKDQLRQRLRKLHVELNRLLAEHCGVDPTNLRQLAKWEGEHHPFHWFVEFYGILHDGGFDVIIGNPPYAEIPKELSRPLLQQSFRTVLERWSRDEDLYTLVVERALALLRPATGQFGMILPLSLAFSTKKPFGVLRTLLAAEPSAWWWSHFDRIPSALFGNDVRTRCTIALGSRSARARVKATTPLLRWTNSRRETLFTSVAYSLLGVGIGEGIPKVGSQAQADALAALSTASRPLGDDLLKPVSFSVLADAAPKFPQPCVYVGGTAYNWFPAWRDIPETTTADGEPSLPARTAGYKFSSEDEANCVFALLCSSMGYWWWAVASDGFNLKKWLIERFPLSRSALKDGDRKELARLGAELRKELRRHYVYKDNKGRIGNFFLPDCVNEVRNIDEFLGSHVRGLTNAFVHDVAEFNATCSRAEAAIDEDDEED